MSTLRVSRARLTAQAQVKLRVSKVSLTAQAPVVTKLRVAKVSLAAIGGVSVAIVPQLVVGPGELVTLTADLLTGGSGTWFWRRISGPAVGLSVDLGEATFTAPSIWNADRTQPTGGDPGEAVLVLGVSALVGGVQSPEVRCEVTILPQLSWSRGSSSWLGSRSAPA